jgi:hypothetical protein
MRNVLVTEVVMSCTADDDSDWTQAPTLPAPASEPCPPFVGVWRVEAHGEEGIPYPTLIDATAEPPMSPEAEVRGPGGCFAQSALDRAGWVITRLGAARIEVEANGTLARRVA